MFEVKEEFVLLLDKWSVATFFVPFLSLISMSNSCKSTGVCHPGVVSRVYRMMGRCQEWRKDGSSRNTYSKLLGRGLSSRSVGDSKLSSAVIAMNSSNSEKISSSRRVPSMEWMILLPSSRRAVNNKDHSFNPNSKIELFLFNLNNCISSVKKGSSHDEGNFDVFFHFENNKISMKGLRVLKDSFAYKEYGIRLMLAPRSAKALQEKVLLKLHGIRKLLVSSSFGETLFWIIAELSSLKKAAEICSILCLLLMISFRNFP
uniref:Uncharacterized protein n=1 Tax=Tanacetum cinerariifolium TaxID=118510 RepID=A0A699HFS9_TANCI|nr:hypothetical protein [Tanacetum cinerariifolium]